MLSRGKAVCLLCFPVGNGNTRWPRENYQIRAVKGLERVFATVEAQSGGKISDDLANILSCEATRQNAKQNAYSGVQPSERARWRVVHSGNPPSFGLLISFIGQKGKNLWYAKAVTFSSLQQEPRCSSDETVLLDLWST